MANRIRLTCIAAGLFIYFGLTGAPEVRAQLPFPVAQETDSKNPSPELIDKLTKGLSIKPDQAIGGAGALFGLAKTRLKPADFTKVADVVPGMDGLLNAAPKPKEGGLDMLGAMGGMLPGKAGEFASVAGTFKSLGLSPKMAVKFIPIMTKFVEAKGGSAVGNLLGGALK